MGDDVIEYLLNAIGFVLCVGIMVWALDLGLRMAIDSHHRGMARVHRGTSWSSRGRL